MNLQNKKYLEASSVLVGACVGAGALGVPYVTSRSGFFITLFYLILLGGIVLLINLYLGETALRTKRDHELTGYAKKYLGRRWGLLMNFSLIFGIYAAIIAYLVGVGESVSFLIFENLKYSVLFGVLFGLFMASLFWKGTKSLKKYEKYGVFIILALISLIFFLFIGKVNYSNLGYTNFSNFLFPFGVILFAIASETAIPVVSLVLDKEKVLMKKIIITGSVVSFILYVLFTFIVVGVNGTQTPEVATFALGSIFVLLGIFTMFTSHFSLGNALRENFQYDDKIKKLKTWFFVSIVPIFLYVIISFFPFFSFTKILSIGGVISGGIMGILSLFIVKRAKKRGKRKPEYVIPINWGIIIFFTLIFLLGMVSLFY